MATPTFNPYPSIGTQLTTGLDSIAADFAGGFSSVDDLVTSIYNYIQPLYFPTTGGTPVPLNVQIEIKSVVYNVINTYNNNPHSASLLYGPKQSYFIDLLLGLKTTNTTPINAIDQWLLDVEDNISKDNLTIAMQTSLFLATECGKSVYPYWVTHVSTPGNWAGFFNGNVAIDYANIPFWTAACMEGALIGAQATSRGLIAPTTNIVTVNIVSALIGALAIGAGKVLFEWVPRLQPSSLVANTPEGGCGCGGK
jgi:hypothetical protein